MAGLAQITSLAEIVRVCGAEILKKELRAPYWEGRERNV